MTDILTAWIASSFSEAVQAFNRGEHDLAQKQARALLAASPNHDGAMHLLGLCALRQGRNDEAVAWLGEAVLRNPADGDRLAAFGMAQKAAGNVAGALQSLEQAASLLPHNAQIRINQANLLQDQGDFDKALDLYRQAARIDPNNALLRYNLGLSLLTLGQFEEGWAEAEWRWKAACLDLERVDFNAPAWKGEELQGKTLLLWTEQGLGDTIMFCRYVPILAERGVRVLLQAPKSLHPLLSSLQGLAGLFAEGDPLPPFDAQAPLLAVPGRMGTILQTIPGQTPYLHATTERIAAWRDKLKHLKGVKIGLGWRGNPAHANDANRSLPAELLAPLFKINGMDWIGVQPDPGPCPPPIFNAGPELVDWGDTAGLMTNLDLMIAVDSSAAHLAGALGIPCWLLLPYLPDWRWLLKRQDSPWYPTFSLFRQQSPQDWPGVILKLQEALSSHPR
ncbi:Glycerol-3-phosphate acyltransferase PlsX (fragment) [Rhodospirillaceae bacterium LM-1]